jgi:hypothetical protein
MAVPTITNLMRKVAKANPGITEVPGTVVPAVQLFQVFSLS